MADNPTKKGPWGNHTSVPLDKHPNWNPDPRPQQYGPSTPTGAPIPKGWHPVYSPTNPPAPEPPKKK